MSRRLNIVLAAVVVVLVAIALIDGKRRSTLAMAVDGTVNVARGRAVGAGAATFTTHPRTSALLDFDRKLLRARSFPGAVVAGRGASGGGDASRRDRLDRGARGGKQPLSRALLASGLRLPGDGPTSLPPVALTFDDGPSPRYTPLVLATLKKLHVRATFFVVGYLAQWYPWLVRQEAQAGMAIGNHSYTHPEAPAFEQLPRRLMEDEIALGAQALCRLGVRPRLFRPPGGSSSRLVVRVAAGLGERVVLWSVDPSDWQSGVRAREIERRVLAAVRPGSIVVLHDGGGDRSATITALPAIVKGIRHRGLRLVALTPRSPGPRSCTRGCGTSEAPEENAHARGRARGSPPVCRWGAGSSRSGSGGQRAGR